MLTIWVLGLAGFVRRGWCQTPVDFQPSSEAKLGIKYTNIEITPPGTVVQTLDLVSLAPIVNIPPSVLTDSSGKIPANSRFMVFIIDIDDVTNGTATTILHWFQPNLVPETTKIAALLDKNQNVNLQVFSENLPVASQPVQQPAQKPAQKPARRQAKTLPIPAIVNTPKPAAKAQPPSQPFTIPHILQETVYLPPSPIPGPAHRYVMLLFPQPANFSIPTCFSNIISIPAADALVDLQGRVGFDLASFLLATGSTKTPLAGNFFRAQNPQRGSLAVNVRATSLRKNSCPPATRPAPVGTGVPGGAGLGPKLVINGNI